MLEINSLILHNGLDVCSTSSRRYGLSPASVTTSTWHPSNSSTSNLNSAKSIKSRSGFNRTNKSTSLVAQARPDACEPNTRRPNTPWRRAIRRMARECFSKRVLLTSPFDRLPTLQARNFHPIGFSRRLFNCRRNMLSDMRCIAKSRKDLLLRDGIRLLDGRITLRFDHSTVTLLPLYLSPRS